MERVAATGQLMVRGYLRAMDLMPPMRVWAAEHNEPEPTLSTIKDDMRRVKILAVESATEAALNVVDSMAAVERTAWDRAQIRRGEEDNRTKREYLELAGRMVEARDRHEHQGIEAALAERGLVLAERYAEIMLTVIIEVVGRAPIDRQTQQWIRDQVAAGLQARVIDARPARLEAG